MIFIGIDPGLDGAIAAVDANRTFAAVFDMPVLELKDGRKKKRTLDLRSLLKILTDLTAEEDCHAFIELVHSMPRQGVRSMFTMGEGYGALKMALTALRIPFEEITPQRWKKMLLYGTMKDKDASRSKAQQLFPSMSLSRKKDHGRADALLIAEFGRRQFLGEAK